MTKSKRRSRAAWEDEFTTIPESEWQTIFWEAMSLFEEGQYDRAVVVATKALQFAEQALEPEHTFVATSLDWLADSHVNLNQHAQAEPHYKRALAIREIVGEPHNIAGSLNQLANLYQTQGQFAKAEALIRRALEICEVEIDIDDRAVALYSKHLALLHAAQEQYAQAEPLYKRALAILDKELGPDHLIVAFALTNLAELYAIQGQHAQAEPLYKRALAILGQDAGANYLGPIWVLEKMAQLHSQTARKVSGMGLEQRLASLGAVALFAKGGTVGTGTLH